jgi:hypothetical protein
MRNGNGRGLESVLVFSVEEFLDFAHSPIGWATTASYNG